MLVGARRVTPEMARNAVSLLKDLEAVTRPEEVLDPHLEGGSERTLAGWIGVQRQHLEKEMEDGSIYSDSASESLIVIGR